jgi:hypothetical protein
MTNHRNRINRLLLTSTLLGLAFVSGGCSYLIKFKLKNASCRTIAVNYTVKNINNGLAPLLVQKNLAENRVESVPFPNDRLSVDIENGTVEFTLLADEEVEVDRVSDTRQAEHTFNLTKLRIMGGEGSILLEGREAFKSFRPINKSWYEFGPEISASVFEYK